MNSNTDLQTFLAAVAARTPAPGGGAVVGVLGAEAAALAAMVCRFSSEQFNEAALDCDALGQQFLDLGPRDEQAFTALMASYQLKKDSPGRAEEIQQGLHAAMAPSRDALKLIMDLAAIVSRLHHAGNRNLVTDTGMAASIAAAVIVSAEMNIRINLRSIKDESIHAEVDSELASAATLRKDLEVIRDEVLAGLA